MLLKVDQGWPSGLGNELIIRARQVQLLHPGFYNFSYPNFPSSERCHAYGHVLDKLPLEIKEWDCVCGSHNLRYYNAALNLLAVGRTVLRCRDGGSISQGLST